VQLAPTAGWARCAGRRRSAERDGGADQGQGGAAAGGQCRAECRRQLHQLQLFLVNEQKYFASSDGSYIDQDVHRIWLPFTATAIDKASGRFRTRAGLSRRWAWAGSSWMAMPPASAPARRRGLPPSYDPVEDAIAAASQARQKLTAPSVKPGKYDLVLDPSNLFLTIHENVGHPLELDRVLGYEANYAGTSFATLDKREAGFRWGSDIVNFTADKTQPGSLGAVGYDDEGVKTSAGTWCATASWSTTRPPATRPISSARMHRTAAAMPIRGPACSSSAWPMSRWRRARSR
jgi:TldD protein